MTEFDPEKFEEKYVYYFEELEEAYSAAYQQLHGQYDSAVLRAIDQQVLSESEPFYEGSAGIAPRPIRAGIARENMMASSASNSRKIRETGSARWPITNSSSPSSRRSSTESRSNFGEFSSSTRPRDGTLSNDGRRDGCGHPEHLLR